MCVGGWVLNAHRYLALLQDDFYHWVDVMDMFDDILAEGNQHAADTPEHLRCYTAPRQQVCHIHIIPTSPPISHTVISSLCWRCYVSQHSLLTPVQAKTIPCTIRWRFVEAFAVLCCVVLCWLLTVCLCFLSLFSVAHCCCFDF